MKTWKSRIQATLCVLAVLGAAVTLNVTAQAPATSTVVVNWSVPGTAYTATQQAQQFTAFLGNVDLSINKQLSGTYSQSCTDWTTNAMRYRDLGISGSQSKPMQPMAYHSVISQSGTNPVTLTVTTVQGPDLIGNFCPDLPPTSGGTFVLGPSYYGSTVFFLVGPGDTVTVGAPFQAPDGHTYVKQQYFTGLQLYWKSK